MKVKRNSNKFEKKTVNALYQIDGFQENTEVN